MKCFWHLEAYECFNFQGKSLFCGSFKKWNFLRTVLLFAGKRAENAFWTNSILLVWNFAFLKWNVRLFSIHLLFTMIETKSKFCMFWKSAFQKIIDVFWKNRFFEKTGRHETSSSSFKNYRKEIPAESCRKNPTRERLCLLKETDTKTAICTFRALPDLYFERSVWSYLRQ